MNFERSESIDQLAEALAKAQRSMKAAVKDADNPFFKNKYADLSSCWEACREHLSANGLAVIQPVSAEGHTVTVTTLLTHLSGQFIASDLRLTSEKSTPQAIGSAITYGRRYGLSATVGIAPEDDDGENAEGRGVQRGSAKAAKEVADRKIAEATSKATTPINGDAALTATLAKSVERSRTTNNFEMLTKFAKIKAVIGDEDYYAVLGAHGFEKSNQISDVEKGRVIYGEMKQIMTGKGLTL